MGMYDDLLTDQPATGGAYDDLLVEAPKSNTRPMPADTKSLPGVWDVDVGGARVRGMLTTDANGKSVYAVRTPEGAAVIQRRKDNGELILQPMAARGSRGIVADAKDAALGTLQGAADALVNAPARVLDTAINGGARLIDKGLQAVGIDTSGTPSLDQMAADKLGLAPSMDQALANQNDAFLAETGDSLAGRIGRIGGNAAATVPLAAMRATEGAGFGANLANGALQGGVSGAAIAAGRGDQDVSREAGTGAVVGAAVNAALPPIVRTAAAAFNAAKAPAKATAAAAQPVSDDLIKQAQMAVSRANLSWEQLDDPLRAKIVRELQQAQTIGGDIPEDALVRKAIYESQGLKPTRGMVTRNWEDAWREQNLMTEPEGAPLRDIYTRNNATIRQNIDDMAPRDVQPVEVPTFGAGLRQSLSANERAAAKEVSGAYTAAKEVEGGNLADVSDLANFISQNKSRLLASGDQGKFVLGYLDDMDALGENGLSQALKSGKASATGVQIPLKELTDLRAIVNNAWRQAPDQNAAAVLNEMRQMLNRAEWQAGGELFKQARQMRQAKGNAFENNPLIDKLLSKQKGYNADLIEDSQVFDRAIVKASPEQFKATWLRIDEPTRKQTQAQLSDFIKSQVFSNQGRNEAGDVVASAAKLDKVVKDIGPQKLRMVFGEQKAKDLQMLARSLGELSNPPRGTVPQGSAPKLAFLSRAIMGTLSLGGKLPAGEMFAGGADLIKRGGAIKLNQAAVDDALNFYAPYRRDAMQKVGQRGALFGAPAGGTGGILFGGMPEGSK